LYFYDLAGSEDVLDIILNFVNIKYIPIDFLQGASADADFKKYKIDKNHYLGLDSIPRKRHILEHVDRRVIVEKMLDILVKEIGSFSQRLSTGYRANNDITTMIKAYCHFWWFKYIFYNPNLTPIILEVEKKVSQSININEVLKMTDNDFKIIIRMIKTNVIKDRIDILLESEFINESLSDLRTSLDGYTFDNNKLSIDKLGLYNVENNKNIPIEFEKVIMFGFIRNDIGYPTQKNDTTFLEGTLKTLEFLHSLTPQSKLQSMQKGGVIYDHIEPKQLLLESANKVAESAFENIMDGGGVIDKSVKDTDRAVVIIVTLIIAFLSVYLKNTLSNKGILKNKTEELTSLVAFYAFFTLLFTSLIELNTVDTTYFITYLLVFCIINIALNTYQEPNKQSLIKDHINGQIINEYKEMDNNLIVSWMLSSIGVIFI
jgi:hypothetical protein